MWVLKNKRLWKGPFNQHVEESGFNFPKPKVCVGGKIVHQILVDTWVRWKTSLWKWNKGACVDTKLFFKKGALNQHVEKSNSIYQNKKWCVGGKIVGLNNLNGHVANPHSHFLKKTGMRGLENIMNTLVCFVPDIKKNSRVWASRSSWTAYLHSHSFWQQIKE